jgi:hypothetical protein
MKAGLENEVVSQKQYVKSYIFFMVLLLYQRVIATFGCVGHGTFDKVDF